MSTLRTGVYVEDFLDDTSSLPQELQRILSTMRELDERSQNLQSHNQLQLQECLELPPLHQLKKNGGKSDLAQRIVELRKEIAENDEKVVGLCTEKVLLAQQAFDLLEGHEKRLEEDMAEFQKELKQEGKLPSVDTRTENGNSWDRRKANNTISNLTSRTEYKRENPKSDAIRSSIYHTPMESRNLFPDLLTNEKERENDDLEIGYLRSRENNVELMPPPAQKRKIQHQTSGPLVEFKDLGVCVCGKEPFGDMIKCDNEQCQGGTMFHPNCVQSDQEPKAGQAWYCPTCKNLSNVEAILI